MDNRLNYSSHAALDISGRHLKAAKIHQLLPLAASPNVPLRLLEVGTGSGAIAQYFSILTSQRFIVSAVDVNDQRMVSDGYDFQLYDGQHLPYKDETFDIVISNHVIEHVGNYHQQSNHLVEICRVLAKNGYAYLATPSKWQIVEPHFNLPFLSWIPRGMRDSYVRLAGKGNHYDCNLLRPAELRRLLKATGLPFKNMNTDALKALISIEQPRGITMYLLALLPNILLEMLRNSFPTSIFLIHKPVNSKARSVVNNIR